MNIENVVIARKLSVLEYDMKREDISLDAVVARFKSLGTDGKRILESHTRQLESFQKIAELFNNPVIMVGDDLDRELLRPASLVISIGGDNYFQNVAHFLEDQLIIGVNSDPVNSDGSLTSFTSDSLKDFLTRLKENQFNIEEWTTLKATLNGRRLKTPSVSEIYIGAYKSTDMSRYLLNGEEQKSSGLIITTPAGRTGWYSAAYRYIYQYDRRGSHDFEEPVLWPMVPYDKTDNAGFLIVREPFVADRTKAYHFNVEGIIRGQEKFIIKWLAHGLGLLSIDAKDEHELKRGDVVEVEISDKPLKVVVP